MMHRICWAGLAALLALAAAAPAFAEDKVELKVLKYDDLTKFIKDNKGKVIVVDFWQNSCVECKREMPRLFELKKKYDKDLVAVTVNLLDDGQDLKDEKAKAEKFLQSKNASNTTNVILDEKVDVWSKKLNVTSFPTVFVFDQDGKYEKRYPEDQEKFNYEDIGKVVAGLLKK
jgi:thiol-disulfide isomerase/thioredoxin